MLNKNLKIPTHHTSLFLSHPKLLNVYYCCVVLVISSFIRSDIESTTSVSSGFSGPKIHSSSLNQHFSYFSLCAVFVQLGQVTLKKS